MGAKTTTELKDRLAAAARRTKRTAAQKLSYAEGKAAGAKARLQGAGTVTPEDDRVVVNEIKAALATLDYPTQNVKVEVVEGCATLRGELERPDQIREMRHVLAGVPGVSAVESYLHLPGTDAPNKAASLDVTPPVDSDVADQGT